MYWKLVLLLFLGVLPFGRCFMTPKELNQREDLKLCYAHRTDARLSEGFINGQELPLPMSIETFTALVERYETEHPNMPASELTLKLMTSFRVADVPADFRAWSSVSVNSNKLEKAFFNLPPSSTDSFRDEDFSADERCALHFMLSHSINSTTLGVPNEEIEEDGTTKHPRERGVVSVSGKRRHALSLSNVLLGVLAGLMGGNDLNAADIYRRANGKTDDELSGVKVDRLVAITVGDIVSIYLNKDYKKPSREISFLPNGQWDDQSCTSTYSLDSNNKKFVSNSVLRGAIDGLIIGRKIEEKPDIYQNMRLSQILRLYYGPFGLIDDIASSVIRTETQWCNRETLYRQLTGLEEHVLNAHRLFTAVSEGYTDDTTVREEVNDVLGNIRDNKDIFSEIAAESSNECGSSEATLDKRCTTPYSIFAILDFPTPDTQRNFQIEVIGNLSLSFSVRPRGSMVGVYTNLSPQRPKTLHAITNNSAIAGCQSCFAKHYIRRGSKISELQVFENLNGTLSEYVEDRKNSVHEIGEAKSGEPGKVILYFTYNSGVTDDYRLREALWEIEKNYREATILASGSNQETLRYFTLNDDTDVFPTPNNPSNAADFAKRLRERICKVPGEFRFEECYRNTRGAEAENRFVNSIGLGKKQYWAMYPKYFHKSFGATLKFKPLDGAQIKVCFSRQYYRILDDNAQYVECHESSGDEIKFDGSNPCKRRNIHNCDPFYFSVEAKKGPSERCEGFNCNTPRDIQFEFQHEGISCSSAVSILSSLALTILLSVFLLASNHRS